jgi:hypothetical protein
MSFVYVDLIYLYFAIGLTLFGSGNRIINHDSSFQLLSTSFMVYITIDTIWIFLYPRIAPSGATIVLLHHIICIASTILSTVVPGFGWFLGAGLLNELSTCFVTMRRNTPMGSFLYYLTHYLLIATWFPVRLGVFPALCVLLAFRYYEYSSQVGTYLNIVMIGFVSQIFLTYLSVSWSIDFIRKLKKQ